MLAKGFILGKAAVSKAKTIDQKIQLMSTATSTVTSLDKKIKLSDKIITGTSTLNSKVKDLDQKFQVSKTTKSAFTAAEKTDIRAGSAIMKNRYVFMVVSWAVGVFNKVAKAGTNVGSMTKEKVVVEETQHKGSG